MSKKFRTNPKSAEEADIIRKDILHRFVDHVSSFDYKNNTIIAKCLQKHEIWFYFGHALLIKPEDRENKVLSGDLEEIKIIEHWSDADELFIETYEGYSFTAEGINA